MRRRRRMPLGNQVFFVDVFSFPTRTQNSALPCELLPSHTRPNYRISFYCLLILRMIPLEKAMFTARAANFRQLGRAALALCLITGGLGRCAVGLADDGWRAVWGSVRRSHLRWCRAPYMGQTCLGGRLVLLHGCPPLREGPGIAYESRRHMAATYSLTRRPR